jgi:uncharacterized membrane protein
MAEMSPENMTHNASQAMSEMCDTMGCTTTANVGETERLISLVGGSAIFLYGWTRGTLPGLAIAAIGGALVYRGVTGNCQMYRAMGVSTNRDENTAIGVPAQYGFKFEKSFTINRPAEELYYQWRRFENLPRIMRHLQSVEEIGGGRSRWTVHGPLGVPVSWEAEVINEDPGRMIAWRSLPGSEVDTAGSVHFDEHGGATLVRVSLKYNPPGGQIGASIARLLGSGAEQEIEDDMRRFKQTMETGEAASTLAQPSGRHSS